MQKTHMNDIAHTPDYLVGYNLYEICPTRLNTSESPTKCYYSLEGPGSHKTFLDNKALSLTSNPLPYGACYNKPFELIMPVT